MKKLVINKCNGGFGLSVEAIEMYLTKTGNTPFYKYVYCGTTMYASKPFVGDRSDGKYFHDNGIERDNPVLIEVVETLGVKKASGRCAELKIISIPDDIKYEIHDYDGKEIVRECSRSWN